tara:strand:- start:90 stop:1790 length:1701 start_codon:yes stop_codon:yes gene_type:complete
MFDENIWRDSLEYKEEEWNVDTDGYSVKEAIKVEEIPSRNLFWIFVLYRDKKIASLEGFLQRPVLKEIWEKNAFQKSKEYMTSAFLGTSLLDSFILVPINLVANEIDKLIKTEEDSEYPDSEVISQLNEMKKKVYDFIEKGVLFLILDGQTRLFTSIARFFRDDFKLPVNGIDGKEIIIEKGKEIFTVNNKFFSELDDISKNVLKSIMISVNVITKGSLSLVIDALIGKQMGIPWTDWQKVYLSEYISVFGKRIQDSLPSAIEDWLLIRTNLTKGTKYTHNKNGFEYFHALLLYWMTKGQVKKVSDESFTQILKPGQNIVKKATVDKLRSIYKNELMVWSSDAKYIETMNEVRNAATSKSGKNDKKLPYNIVKAYILLRNAMFKSEKSNGISREIPKIKILSEPLFVDAVIKEHLKLSVQYKSDGSVNTDSYIEDKSKPLDKKTQKYPLMKRPDGYIKAFDDEKTDYWKTIESYLINWLIDNQEELEKLHIIKDETSMPSKAQILVSNDFKEMRTGDDIPATELIRPEIERGHKISRKNKGDNSIENIEPQYKKDNRSYSDTNIIN